MTKTMQWVLAAALAAVLTACGGSSGGKAEPPGGAKVTFALQGPSAPGATHVDMTVEGVTDPSFEYDATAVRSGTDGEFQVELTTMPAGDYTLSWAEAQDAAHGKLYQLLSPVSFTVIAGHSATLPPILLQQVAPPAFSNGAPFISALQVTSSAIDPYDKVLQLAAQFEDADAARCADPAQACEERIFWAWTANDANGAACGSFGPVATGGDEANGSVTNASPKIVSIEWNAGACTGTVTITFAVKDLADQRAALSQTFQVMSLHGGAYVTMAFNNWPTIDYVGIANSQLAPGSQEKVDVDAADADGDALGYKWTTNCDGATIAPDSLAGGTFTVDPQAGANQVCDISVHVFEIGDTGNPGLDLAHPGVNDGTVTVLIRAPIDPLVAPVIEFAYMTPKWFGAGLPSIEFHAYASDKDRLVWSWEVFNAVAGEQLLQNGNEATLTFPSACSTGVYVMATVTDTVEHVSNTVRFTPSCP